MPSLRSIQLGAPKSQPSLEEIRVLVLAGGQGTRLRPVYNAGPKVMAPVGERPFLWYVLRTLRRAGLRHIILCVGYKHEQIEAWAGDGRVLGLQILYSIESQPLGTAGALRLAANRVFLSSRFVVVNGDSILQLDFKEMLDFHVTQSARVTLARVRARDAARFGRIEADDRGWVQAFSEKPHDAGISFINGGVYIFEREIVYAIPAGRAVSLEREVLPGLVGHGLLSFATNGHFIDMGIPEDFARAQVLTEVLQL